MLRLHYAPDNASLVVRLVLLELGLPFQPVLVDRAARAQDGAAFRALNPRGLIPVLETPEGPLFETAAICLWLADREGRMAPGPAEPERGHLLKWLFFVSNTLHADLRMQFYPRQYADDPAVIQPLTAARLAGHFGLLEGLALARHGWFGGEAPSILDCYVATTMRWAALYTSGTPRWFHAGDYPALQAMAARMETRESVRNAAAAEGLGARPFTRPQPCRPPEGVAL